LSEAVEHVSRELKHLVQKEHAVMGEANFARTRQRASTD
jgi:hypothetical protein